jgi:hypothetical protein
MLLKWCNRLINGRSNSGLGSTPVLWVNRKKLTNERKNENTWKKFTFESLKTINSDNCDGWVTTVEYIYTR